MRKFFSSLYWGETKPQQRVEVFDAFWNELLQFSEQDDNEDETVVPKVLNKIIQLLLEDERDIDNGTGECIEKFLKGRVMETLCRLAQNDKPPGMYRWIVHAISRIFQHMKSPLLAHMSIHKPVVHLLKGGAVHNLGPEERMECLHLIDAIVLKLKEDPVFVRLFFEEMGSGALGPTSAVKYTATGSPIKPPASPELAGEDKKRFVLFSSLETMYNLGGDSRLVDQLRRSILSCLAVDDNHDNVMDTYYASQTDFLNNIVDGILQHYWRALIATPKHAGIQEGFQLEEVQSYVKMVQFVNALTMLPHRDLFTEKLLSLLKSKFISVIMSGLLSEDIEMTNLHTIFVRETLIQLDSKPFFELLVHSLVEVEPESIPVLDATAAPSTAAVFAEGTKLVKEVLISRLDYRKKRSASMDGSGRPAAAPVARHDSLLVAIAEENLHREAAIVTKPEEPPALPAVDELHNRVVPAQPTQLEQQASEAKSNVERLEREQISVNTLRLFCTLLSFHPDDKYVIENLILRCPPCDATGSAEAKCAQSIAEGSVAIKEFLHRIDQVHLQLAQSIAASLPEGANEEYPHETSTMVYVTHAERKLNKNKVFFNQWFAKPTEAATTSTPVTSADGPVERPFMKVIFRLLDRFLEHNLDMNLALTEVIARLAQHPSKVLHAYLLTAESQPTRQSLIECLERLATVATKQIFERPEIALGADKLIRHWSHSRNIECVWEFQDETTRIIQGVVLLEEFCKELHALLSSVDKIITTPPPL